MEVSKDRHESVTQLSLQEKAETNTSHSQVGPLLELIQRSPSQRTYGATRK
jgi:hypothetical protein